MGLGWLFSSKDLVDLAANVKGTVQKLAAYARPGDGVETLASGHDALELAHLPAPATGYDPVSGLSFLLILSAVVVTNGPSRPSRPR